MGTPGTPTVPASLAQVSSSKPFSQLPREQVPSQLAQEQSIISSAIRSEVLSWSCLGWWQQAGVMLFQHYTAAGRDDLVLPMGLVPRRSELYF